jgi:hypothetical protein
VDIHAGVHGGQPALRAGQLEPSNDLLLRAVAAELGVGRACRGGADEVIQVCLERVERRVERVEAKSLDAGPGSSREGPGGYERWSIGT